MTRVFGFFLEQANKVLSKPSRLQFRPKSDKGQGVEVLALMMAERKTAWIDADEAEETLDQIHASKGGAVTPRSMQA